MYSAIRMRLLAALAILRVEALLQPPRHGCTRTAPLRATVAVLDSYTATTLVVDDARGVVNRLSVREPGLI